MEPSDRVTRSATRGYFKCYSEKIISAAVIANIPRLLSISERVNYEHSPNQETPIALTEETKSDLPKDWTDQDTYNFQNSFKERGKNFDEISAEIRKSFSDCVFFYYRTKKVTDYKKLVAEGLISRKADTAVRNVSDAHVIAVTGRQRSHISTIKRPNERPLSSSFSNGSKATFSGPMQGSEKAVRQTKSVTNGSKYDLSTSASTTVARHAAQVFPYQHSLERCLEPVTRVQVPPAMAIDSPTMPVLRLLHEHGDEFSLDHSYESDRSMPNLVTLSPPSTFTGSSGCASTAFSRPAAQISPYRYSLGSLFSSGPCEERSVHGSDEYTFRETKTFTVLKRNSSECGSPPSRTRPTILVAPYRRLLERCLEARVVVTRVQVPPAVAVKSPTMPVLSLLDK